MKGRRRMKFWVVSVYLFFLFFSLCNSWQPDPPDSPAVQFVVTQKVVGEDVGSVAVEAWLSATSSREVTVFFSWKGTASDGADFEFGSRVLKIPTGSGASEIVVQIKDDSIAECDETLILSIDSAINAIVSGITLCSMIVCDNDTIPLPGDGLTVISPNGCETYCVGDTMEIRWDIPTKRYLLMIDFSPNNGLNYLTIAYIFTSDDLYHTGPYRWVIPDTICNIDRSECYSVVSDSCMIYVHEYFTPPFFDRSDGVFRIRERR